MQNNHHITVTDKTKVEIEGATAVISFDEDGVLIDSSVGKISVEGRELRIENFEKVTGKILITGNVIGAFYIEKAEKKKGRGLFK